MPNNILHHVISILFHNAVHKFELVSKELESNIPLAKFPFMQKSNTFMENAVSNLITIVTLFKGALQCPFCDLSSHDVTANEMTLHVNSAHLEYLTPEREDVAFLEDYESMSDFDSIWQLEKVRLKSDLSK